MGDNKRMPFPQKSSAAQTSEPPPLGALLRDCAARLAPASDSPRLDCELLLAHALGIERAALYANSDLFPDANCARRFRQLLAERARGRPVAQIIGRKEFYSLDFEITPDVLAPRPETELLVDLLAESVGRGFAAPAHKKHAGSEAVPRSWREQDALAPRPASGRFHASGRKERGAPRCLELGTGCGAVAVALARIAPRARIVATDVSAAALAVARRNAERLAPGRIRFVEGSWYDPTDDEWRFDAIACNPPYVESPLGGRPPLCFEPSKALDGGPDGLRELREVISGAPQYLRHGGTLVVEHGAGQAEAVRALMRKAGLQAPGTRRDLAGHPRVTLARKAPRP